MDSAGVCLALASGELTLQGQFLHGSNYTFLAHANYQGQEMDVVYKPVRGEQPLWDFPFGTLAKREVAAFWVSEALGWELVPPTIFRQDAPLGPGSLQLYIEHDPDIHYFNFEADDRQRLRPVMLFDLIANNADRKGSHILLDRTGHIWLIDHGLCFHQEEKLRTVIWDFSGEKIPQPLIEDLKKLAALLKKDAPLYKELRNTLTAGEITALRKRTRGLIQTTLYPLPPSDRRVYPWPPV